VLARLPSIWRAQACSGGLNGHTEGAGNAPGEEASLISEHARRRCRAATRSIPTHMRTPQQQSLTGHRGALDAEGASDHDQPYRFAWQPRADEVEQRIEAFKARAATSCAQSLRSRWRLE
jgi:hypothetical protein